MKTRPKKSKTPHIAQSEGLIDRQAGVPLYLQIASVLRREIASGVSTILPSERKLAERFGVERLTLRRSLEILTREGYLRKDKGRSVVAHSTGHTHGKSGPLTFTYIITTMASEFHSQLCAAIERAAHHYHLNPVFKVSHYDAIQEELLLEQALQSGTHGLLISPVLPASSMALYTCLQERHIPTVFLGRDVPGVLLPSVSVNDAHAFDLLVDHLRAKGHTRIGYITGQQGAALDMRRISYEMALRRVGLQPRSAWIGTGEGFHHEAGMQAAAALMKPVKDRPTAILAHNDIMALGALEWLQSHGYDVPRDVALAGFDNLPSGENTPLPLTTVRYSIAAMANLSVQILSTWMRGTDPELRTQFLVQPNLVVRRSSDAQWTPDKHPPTSAPRLGYFI